MRTFLLKHAGRAFGQTHFVRQLWCLAIMGAWLLAATSVFATGATVDRVSGGPWFNGKFYGYVNGNIASVAKYNTPRGIAFDASGNYLLVTDYTNNAIRYLDFNNNATYTLIDGMDRPVGVAIDSDYYVYILNRGNGANGTVLTYDFWLNEWVAINTTGLTNAAGIALDSIGNIYVSAGNRLYRITGTNRTTVATITEAGASLQGIVVKNNGLIAACDSGRHGVYLINPTTGQVTTNSGFHGVGDFVAGGFNISSSNSAKFFQPMGVAEVGDGSLVVTDYGNHRVKRVLNNGTVTNLYGVSSNYWISGSDYPGFKDGTVSTPDQLGGVAARLPSGLALAPNGMVYVTEDYYHIIRKVVAGLAPPLVAPSAPTDLIATAGYGQVVLAWVASSGATNYNIKRSLVSGGPYTNTYASTRFTTYTDTNVVDGTTYYYVVTAVGTGGESASTGEASATPMFSPVPTILTVTTNYGQVSLTWSTSVGATSYNVKRAPSSGGPYTTIFSPTNNAYTDTSVVNGMTYFYVVSAVNTGGESANSAEVSATPPVPPPPDPRIGWYDYEGDWFYGFYTWLHPVSVATFHNDTLIAVDPHTNGVNTYYLAGPTPVTDVPSATNGFSPPFYQDGLSYVQPLPITPTPDLTVKAVNQNSYGTYSAVTTARFIFQVANPVILGYNAAYFQVSDTTSNAVYWYTIDGSDPTNAPPSIGPITTIATNGSWASLSLDGSTNVLFKVRAFRNGYFPSGIAIQSFSPSNFVPNSISFGFTGGEASSDFVASPGQMFYAPVTLSPLETTEIYSLQFNLMVTNNGSAPAVAPGAFGFSSLLVKPIKDDLYTEIPPYMFLSTNPVISVMITNHVYYGGSTNFVSLLFTNSAYNLMGVGWAERAGYTNLYDTLSQDLIKYSMAHDTLFEQENGKVILGGFNFRVPTNALSGDSYRIRIGRPSATDDGVGATGSDVYIHTPTNGSLGAGALNAIKNVTIGQRKYLVGNAYPFRWFNAGDFGNTNLQDADVIQVFQSAVYGLNSPEFQAPGSDFLDVMDSSGQFGVLDGTTGYYTNAGPLTLAQQSALFNGDDTTINQIVFGNGILEVDDIYVTYRRSLDPTLTCYQRFWQNGARVAEIVPNDFAPSPAFRPATIARETGSGGSINATNQPRVVFTAGDIQTSAGATIAIPISASVLGDYPLRTLMLSLNVVPLDGSPALTTAVSFSYNTALGTPYRTAQYGNGNYSAVWLNNGIAGLSDNVTLGTLYVTLPANATSASAYAVHFDHASASPNGMGLFAKTVKTGLITLADRSSSSYGDGIPDSWRLRYFLTVNNYLSTATADADGDGMDNQQEYAAGTDPVDSVSFFKNIGFDTVAAASPSHVSVISWPSVNGKQYVIERSPILSTPLWTAIATNAGTGNIMEYRDTYHDGTPGGMRFYRVRVQ